MIRPYQQAASCTRARRNASGVAHSALVACVGWAEGTARAHVPLAAGRPLKATAAVAYLRAPQPRGGSLGHRWLGGFLRRRIMATSP